MRKRIISFVVIILIITLLLPNQIISKTIGSPKEKNKVQREYTSFFDQQKNTVSNIEFYTMNNGIFGFDAIRGIGGVRWPRGSNYQYIFGGGFWFGAKKSTSNNEYKKIIELSYNPNNGKSCFAPGRIEEGDTVNINDIKSYRNYFSTDFLSKSGKPIIESDGPNWPIWILDEENYLNDLNFGNFIVDTSKRNNNNFQKGLAISSTEDIFCTYKDTDLRFFDSTLDIKNNPYYPLRLQVEQTIYSWSFGKYKNFIIIYYKFINFSNDTLYDCWFAPVIDPDIGQMPSTNSSNDLAWFYKDDKSLNLAIASTAKEGYYDSCSVGISLVLTPAVDNNYYLRKDKNQFDISEQLGVKTFKNWSISDDPQGDNEKYDQLSSGDFDEQIEYGDVRILLGTGPFNMLPLDTLKVAVLLAFDGLELEANKNDDKPQMSDYSSLVDLVKFAQNFFYNNMIVNVKEKKMVDANYLLYPNPASDIINISTENSAIIDRIELFNVLGEKIFEMTDIFSSEYKLNTRNLHSGSYYIRIKSGNSTETKLLQIAK